MLFLSIMLYQKGRIEVDGVLISTIALMSSFGPVVALANLGSTLQNTFAAGNRVLDILEESPLVKEITEKNELSFSGAAAEHVTFSYDEEEVLSDISVNIPQHSIIGIVGKSGSGKSTLLKLLMRFWNVQSGSVKISNTEISQINTSNLRDIENNIIRSDSKIIVFVIAILRPIIFFIRSSFIIRASVF